MDVMQHQTCMISSLIAKFHMSTCRTSKTSQSGLMRSPLLTGLHEVWEDGQAFKDLRARMRALTESKASIEAARKVRDGTLLR